MVRRGYEHFARTGETDPTVYSTGRRTGTARPRTPSPNPSTGLRACGAQVEEVREALDDFRTEPFEYLDERRFRGRGPHSPWTGQGKRYRGRDAGAGTSFVIEQGQIVSVHAVTATGRPPSSRRVVGVAAFGRKTARLSRIGDLSAAVLALLSIRVGGCHGAAWPAWRGTSLTMSEENVEFSAALRAVQAFRSAIVEYSGPRRRRRRDRVWSRCACRDAGHLRGSRPAIGAEPVRSPSRTMLVLSLQLHDSANGVPSREFGARSTSEKTARSCLS